MMKANDLKKIGGAFLITFTAVFAALAAWQQYNKPKTIAPGTAPK